MDKEWNFLKSNTNRITYSNLNYGDYQLIISKVEKSGHPSEHPYILNIKILPPWYYTVWSKVFYPLAIFVMLAVAMPFAYLNTRSGGVSIKIFAGLMIGISFYALNNIFSFLGVLNTWHPMVVAVVPTSVMLICAAVALWLLERR